jgi:hypothetical protein
MPLRTMLMCVQERRSLSPSREEQLETEAAHYTMGIHGLGALTGGGGGPWRQNANSKQHPSAARLFTSSSSRVPARTETGDRQSVTKPSHRAAARSSRARPGALCPATCSTQQGELSMSVGTHPVTRHIHCGSLFHLTISFSFVSICASTSGCRIAVTRS